jgi:putative oxidoreductase
VSIAKQALLWLITLFLAYVFLRQGVSKFSDTSGWAQAFRAWHYPGWFRIGIGAVEVAAATLLFWPRFAWIGAAMIVAVMLGAMGTHLVAGHPRHMTSEVLPLLLSSVVLFVRRPRR